MRWKREREGGKAGRKRGSIEQLRAAASQVLTTLAPGPATLYLTSPHLTSSCLACQSACSRSRNRSRQHTRDKRAKRVTVDQQVF